MLSHRPNPLPGISHHWLTPLAYKMLLAGPLSISLFNLLEIKPIFCETNAPLRQKQQWLWWEGSQDCGQSHCWLFKVQMQKVGYSTYWAFHVLSQFTRYWLFCFSFSTEICKNFVDEPDIPFPPARPTAENLAAICHQGQGRPRYPDSFFRPCGASYLRRQGKAINRLESWYTLCCSGGVAQQSSQILCCAKQAVSLWSNTEILQNTYVLVQLLFWHKK